MHDRNLVTKKNLMNHSNIAPVNLSNDKTILSYFILSVVTLNSNSASLICVIVIILKCIILENEQYILSLDSFKHKFLGYQSAIENLFEGTHISILR